MTDHEIQTFLAWRIGTPRAHTVGQIQATLRDHGGCVIRFTDREGRDCDYRLGDPVPIDADTLVMVTAKTL